MLAELKKMGILEELRELVILAELFELAMSAELNAMAMLAKQTEDRDDSWAERKVSGAKWEWDDSKAKENVVCKLKKKVLFYLVIEVGSYERHAMDS